MQFANQFTDFQIVLPLARQLSWSHFVELLPLKQWKQNYFMHKTHQIICMGKEN